MTNTIECIPCELSTYSLDTGTEYHKIICKICPKGVYKCFSNTLMVNEGYWRLDKKGDKIEECSNQEKNCLKDVIFFFY